jgi:NADH dehydrogenase [ubiquinone] 1 alpha subcomplex assembly factor 7
LFSELPQNEIPLIVIAQEFFDALPVHQFQRTSRGWMERLIDLEDDTSKPGTFRFVLSPGPTVASRALLKNYDSGKIGDVLETSPDSAVLAESIAMRISKKGGAALVVDYGEDHPLSNTLRVNAFYGKW